MKYTAVIKTLGTNTELEEFDFESDGKTIDEIKDSMFEHFRDYVNVTEFLRFAVYDSEGNLVKPTKSEGDDGDS